MPRTLIITKHLKDKKIALLYYNVRKVNIYFHSNMITKKRIYKNMLNSLGSKLRSLPSAIFLILTLDIWHLKYGVVTVYFSEPVKFYVGKRICTVL
jgi:hypothetical protein